MKKKNYLMKNVISLMALLGLTFTTEAQTFEQDGFTYNILNESAVSLVACSSPSNYVVIPDAVEYEGMFYMVTSIGDEVFENCTNIVSVTISDCVETINYHAFSGCSSLKQLYLGASVKRIGVEAFSRCALLTDVTFPCYCDELYIDDFAFSFCTSLTQISLPAITSHLGRNPFDGCYSIQSFTVDSDNEYYTAVDGILFDKNITELIDYPAAKHDVLEYTVPQSVKTIKETAFGFCSGLDRLIINSSVTTIEGAAFYNSTSLNTIECNVTSFPEPLYDTESPFFGSCVKNVILGEGLEAIPSYFFNDCLQLSSVTIPETVVTIGSEAFDDCMSLESIVIPNSVTTIGYHAFRRCTALKSVNIGNGVTSIEDYNFAESDLTEITCKAINPPVLESTHCFKDYSVPTLYVPISSLEAYKTAEVWKNFYNIEGIVFEEYLGDVNGDGAVTINDVTLIIDKLLNDETSIIEAYADMDNDGKVTINDVTALIDMLLEGE